MAELRADVTHHDGWTEIRLEGVIDETSEFPRSGAVTGELLVLDVGGIERINSGGVQAWFRFFNGLKSTEVDMVIRRLTPNLVLLTGLIADFLGSATVDSLLTPWGCMACDYYAEQLQSVTDPIPAAVPCPLCGEPMQFDDKPESYARFLRPAA